MILQDNDNSLELNLVELVVEPLPSKGDRKINVHLKSHGFTGQSNVWLTENDIHHFLADFKKLEKLRQGQAHIRSISPDEFNLRLWTYDKAGHIALEGNLFKKYNGLENKVSLLIYTDNSMLLKYLQEFHQILLSN